MRCVAGFLAEMGEEQLGLSEALHAYVASDPARFHTPGHKGLLPAPFSQAAHYDVTEIAGADSLYEAAGAIAKTEAALAELYGAAGTLLSAGGATLCVQTMLALAARPGQTILCARGVHTSAINAMALLDLRPVWLFCAADLQSGLCGTIGAEQVAEALTEHPDAAAVYITSPTYYGLLSDIAGIAAVCRRHGLPLLVDNAHGAHLKLLAGGLHPMEQGADMCCDSLHKTLPVLTGGAALHIGSPRFLPDAKRRMSLFGSTSPSYLILLSVDRLLPYLRDGAAADLQRACESMAAIAGLARQRGFRLPPGRRDPLRLTLDLAPTGLTGARFRALLLENGVEPELCGDRFCVLLAGAKTRARDYERLRNALVRAPVDEDSAPVCAVELPPAPEVALSLREAVLGESECVALSGAAGRIAAAAVAPCPPGIPLIVPGERFSQFTLRALKNSGILSVNVLKLP